MTSPVRLATAPDEDAIYRLLQKLDADNGLGLPYDEGRVRQSIRMGMEGREGYIGVIEHPEKKGEFVASVGLHLAQPWYSAVWTVHEVWLFVEPAYRKGTGYADALMEFSRLLKKAIERRAEAPVPFFTSVSSRKRLKAKMRWWARRGEMVGAIYLLR